MNTYEPRGHYVKWNKLNGERQVLHDLIFIGKLKKKKLIETKYVGGHQSL